MRTMTHQYDKEYTLALGRINNEHLYARRRGTALYVLTDQPPGILGYTIPETDRPRQRAVQRTIDDYLNDANVTRHDHHSKY
jgi:hypothetical protein